MGQADEPRTPPSDNGYPRQREYKPTPWEIPRRSLLTLALPLFLAITVGFLYLYADNAYPHGPRIFLGYDYVVLNDGQGPAREVPVYGEDTSQLNNPGWVMFMVHGRGYLLIIGSVILLLWAIFVHGLHVWDWWKPRRRLLWPHHPDSSSEAVSMAIDSNLGGWKWDHETARILYMVWVATQRLWRYFKPPRKRT